MHHTGFKIGYSDTGGVYMGKNTQADYHMHHAITIILSLGEPFEISFNNKDSEPYKADFKSFAPSSFANNTTSSLMGNPF